MEIEKCFVGTFMYSSISHLHQDVYAVYGVEYTPKIRSLMLLLLPYRTSKDAALERADIALQIYMLVTTQLSAWRGKLRLAGLEACSFHCSLFTYFQPLRQPYKKEERERERKEICVSKLHNSVVWQEGFSRLALSHFQCHKIRT